VPALTAACGLGVAAHVAEAAGVRGVRTLGPGDPLASAGDANLLGVRGDAAVRASEPAEEPWCDTPPSEDGGRGEASSSASGDAAAPSLAGELFPELSESDDDDRDIDTSSCRRDGVAPARSASVTGVGRDAMAVAAATVRETSWNVALPVTAALQAPGACRPACAGSSTTGLPPP